MNIQIKKINIIIFPIFIFFASIYANGTLTPEGSSKLFSEFPYNDYISQGYTDNNAFVINTRVADYKVLHYWNKIECYQKIGLTRKNLTIKFPTGLLSSLILVDTSAGYRKYSNSNLTLVFHGDGTMWVEVNATCKNLEFIAGSNINLSYDKGGGVVPNPDGDTIPFKASRALKTNWMVISDKAGSNIDTDGGFGVYVRPYKSHSGNTDYFPVMERSQSDSKIVYLKTDNTNYCDGSSFIVSMLPTKKVSSSKDNELLNRRILFLYPGKFSDTNSSVERCKRYTFPTNDVLNTWCTPGSNYSSWDDVETTNNFKYYYPVSTDINSATPVNTIVLFSHVWQFAREVGSTDDHPGNHIPSGCVARPFMPYQTPLLDGASASALPTPAPLNQTTSENALNEFIGRVHSNFSDLKILSYISFLDEYNQLGNPWLRNTTMTGEDYYDSLVAQIDALLSSSGYNFDGFFIDTPPLNRSSADAPDITEPMIICYRLMRYIRENYPSALIIYHASENPIGCDRIWGQIVPILEEEDDTDDVRWDYAGLVQSEIYTPFIDRYTDITFRGEGFPIDIQLNGSQIADHISDHIKYVVDPRGKSNCIGILKWTDTRWTTNNIYFETVEQANESTFKDDAYRKSYFEDNYPVSLDLGATSSRESTSYSFNTNEYDAEDERMNRLMVMDKMLDSYVASGHLIMRSSAGQNGSITDNGTYKRRVQNSWQGPNQTSHTNFDQAYGPFNDYFRPVTIFWGYSKSASGGTISLSKNCRKKIDKENSNCLLSYELYDNYPNPFNPSTTISYSIKESNKVTIKIYDIKGREICTLVNSYQKKGDKQTIWNGKNTIGENCPSGIYVYKITSGNYINSKKMLLIK